MPHAPAPRPLSLVAALRADLRANRARPKIVITLALLRLAQASRRTLGRRNPVSVLCALVYRVFADWLLGIDIPVRTEFGPGVVLHHGIGLVITADTVVEPGVVLHHQTTLGVATSGGRSPRLRSGCKIAPGVMVLGDVEIGAGAVVGAGLTVTRSVPAGHLVTQNKPTPRPLPARTTAEA